MSAVEKTPAIIVDIDGTVANNDHRQHYLDKKPKDWPGFFSELGNDKPKQMVLGAVYMLNRMMDLQPILLTGRYEKYRTDTGQWIMQHAPWLGKYQMFMRADDDYRSDYIMKEEIYHKLIEPHFSVKLVLEDRSSVIKMWRALGLECWQVAAGEF